MIHISKIALALTSVSFMAIATSALAQDKPAQDDGTVSELIVSAQKREENISTVPLSINLVNQQQLERQSVTNIFDLSRVAPSLEVTNAAGQNVGGGGQVRGLGTQSFGVGAVGSVGIVVDGVSQGNTNIADLYDIARVEVLKGPQGTLFGLTTSAGVVNVTTQPPSFSKFSGRIRTELSDEGLAGSTAYGEQILQGMINVPLTEHAGMRLSGNMNRRQGPGRNALDKTLDEHNAAGGRARVLWEASDRLTVNLNADYNHLHGDGPDFFTIFKADTKADKDSFIAPQGNGTSFAQMLANCRLNPTSAVTPVVPGEGNRDYCTTRKITDGNTTYGASVTGEYKFEPFSLTSITAARRNRSNSGASLDIFRLNNAFFLNPATPAAAAPFLPPPGAFGDPTDILAKGSANPGHTDLFTQELRIASPTGSKIEYTTGLFYSGQTTVDHGGGLFTLADIPSVGATPILVNTVPALSTPSSNASYSWALFGQTTYHLNDQLGLIAGARFTREFLRQHSISSAGVVADSRSDIANFSWRAGAQYKFDDTLQGYATVARGYKGPQLAAAICSGQCPVGTPLRVVTEETPTNYEAGAKKVLFGGRVIADFSAFYIKADGYQGQVCVTNTQRTLTCTIFNFDGVISKGLEANLFGRVNDNFTVNTGLIWNPATYGDHAVGQPTKPFVQDSIDVNGKATSDDLSGEQLVNAPEWKATFSGEYRHDLTENLGGFISGDAVYRSEIRYAASLNPLLTNSSTLVLGARVGIRSNTAGWTASAFVRNATDEHIPVLRQAIFPTGNNYGQFLSTGSFRVVGVTLEGNF